ncbi:MAG: hypothetical protein ACHP7K_02400 [Actinomycetales bacterium]
MDQYRIINELLVYSGTLLVALLLFGFILLSFLGVVVVALLGRLAQLGLSRTAAAAGVQWAGLVRHVEAGAETHPPTNAIHLT